MGRAPLPPADPEPTRVEPCAVCRASAWLRAKDIEPEADSALSAALAARVAGAGEAQAVELVNPSFEEDANKDGVPDGWPPDAAIKQPCRTSLDPAIKKEGRYSFRLESAQPTVGWFRQTFPVEPGALYRASAWVRTENVAAGADGKKGTEDDATDPLADVRWTPPAEVETLFERTLKDLPEDFAGRRWRGYLYLYWGKPAQALAEFIRRYDAAPLQQAAINQAIDDIVVGLKAYHGHTLAGERFMAYQKYGPKGEDGKHGTPDDLSDPLKPVLEELKERKQTER